MATSFTNTGSNTGNPQSGLLQHHIAPRYRTPLAPQGTTNIQPNYGSIQHPTAPTVQPTSHTVTTPDGTTTKQTFADTSKTSSTPTQGTPQYYANKEEQVSQPNALGTGAAQASALYGMLGNEAKLAPFAGGAKQGLLQSYANLTRPQSTGNMAGEQGLFDVQRGILQNAANTTADQALQQQRIGQTGYNNLLGASLPGQITPGTAAYNPIAGQNIPGIGASPFAGGQTLGQVEAGKTSAGLHTAYGAAQSVGNNLSSLITSANINPTDPQFVNSINQFLQTGVASNPQYQQFYGTVNDYIASLAPILGVGGNQTDQKTSMAAQMVSQLASGKSIIDTIKYFDALAADKINAYDKAGSGGFGTVGGTSGGGFAESW